MKTSTSKPNEVWYVDFGASNHMKNHEEWFSYLEKREQSGIIETDDDTAHPIEHIRDVPLSHVSQEGRLRNVHHASTITMNLVSVKQIIDQGMQVWFTHHGCFIKEEGEIIVQGRREGRMFIFKTNDVGNTMFDKGQKVESDIDMRHKRIGHVDFHWLQELQVKQIVFGLLKFIGRKTQVCEARQLGK